MFSLLKDAKIMRVANDAVAGTADVTSSVVDLGSGEFDSICWVAALGEVTSGSVLTLTAKENTANSTSSPTPTSVSGGATTAFTAGASDADNNLVVVDVQRPAQRYQYCVLSRTTQNAVVDGIFAILYNSHSQPVTADASVIASALSTPEV